MWEKPAASLKIVSTSSKLILSLDSLSKPQLNQLFDSLAKEYPPMMEGKNVPQLPGGFYVVDIDFSPENAGCIKRALATLLTSPIMTSLYPSITEAINLLETNYPEFQAYEVMPGGMHAKG